MSASAGSELAGDRNEMGTLSRTVVEGVGLEAASSIGLSARQRALFVEAMTIMDAHFALPLLWRSAKLSSWYAVGLLERDGEGDTSLAEKIIENVCAVQYTDKSEENYGTFPSDYTVHPATDAGLVPPSIYGSFDPNNALFVTLAGIMIDSNYGDRIQKPLRETLRSTMRIAVESDSMRQGGIKSDNLYPAYSNAWYMRCVCSAYVGAMLGDSEVVASAEQWAKEAVKAFDQFGTMSEFNSGTYTGVTIFALCLSQYLPQESTLYKHAPRILAALWDQTAETYNPTLKSLSGPWDRTYGFGMTEYCGTLGSTMAGFMSRKDSPLPKALDGCSHYSDLAMIPMQMIVGHYAENPITSATRSKFDKLYSEHLYMAQAISPPFDRSPRKYTYWVEDGLSAGGIEFDQQFVGGACINPENFAPGVIMWDAGDDVPGCGWISYYPTSPCCSIVASRGRLTIRYPPSQHFDHDHHSRTIQLDISSFPLHPLSKDAFASGTASLPGLDVSLEGNVTTGISSLTYGPGRQGLHHYSLSYTVPETLVAAGEVLELDIRWTRTAAPPGRLVLD